MKTIITLLISFCFATVVKSQTDSASAQSKTRYVDCTPVRSSTIDQNVMAASSSQPVTGCICVSTVSQNESASLVLSSCRENENVYYVDGIRVNGLTVTPGEIEDITIITGGIPAMYEGDITLTGDSKPERNQNFLRLNFSSFHSMRFHF